MFVINTINGYNQKQKVSFGTNLILGKGVAERLVTNPSEAQAITEFKENLAKDGKNWNAELTYDTFEPKKVSLEETEKLIKQFAKHYDYDAKRQAEKNISQMKPQEASDLIEKIVKDNDNRLGENCSYLAGRIKDSKIAAVLIEKLIQTPNSRTKENAVYALNEIEDEKQRDELVDKLINSQDPIVRKSAVYALCKMPDSKHFDTVIEKLYNNSDPEIREQVVYVIADVKEEKYNNNAQFYDSVIEKALRDSESSVRQSGYFVIGKLTDSQKAAQWVENVVSGEDDSWEKAKAVASIGLMKDSKLAKSLILKFLEHPDSKVRRGAAEAVARSKDKNLQSELIEKLVNNKDGELRREATWLITDIKEPDKIVTIAEKLLKDSDADVRESMGRQIEYIEDEKARNFLINKHIYTKDFDVRKGIADAIEGIVDKDPDKAKEYAQILAKDENKYIQKEAKTILEKIESQKTTDHYNLKITDGEKVIGQRNIATNRRIFDAFSSAYDAIFKKNS